MNVEVRKIETEYGETGVGVGNRTDVTYELGAEIDGAWVPFASASESKVERLKELAAAEKEAKAQAAPAEPDTASNSETTVETQAV